ncbi:hypothetical protein BB776_02490 [Planococcus salinarum]|uniref:Uncharacterized protein n=1 Tax=Planococcus salinarum TaxID=622695 RepID=A0ABX3D1U6_9BACL|nr:hypothetical protein [Planococcus salinarum]OHX52154.1 hypothetical protein BB776_02490 [Planococcus salinarum]
MEWISHIAEQTEEYYKITDPVDGEYTVQLDLAELESNEGKILFDDGDSRITVLEVVPWEESGYEVIFRSHGAEIPNGTVLVSGVDHFRTGNGLSQSLEAEAVSNGGEAVPLTSSSESGLVYHDGDRFGFYLDAPEGDADEVEVTVTNLQLNLWMEKAIFE